MDASERLGRHRVRFVVDDIPRRALHAPENALGHRLAAIAELDGEDLASLLNVIDALVAKTRLRTLAAGR